MIHAGIRAHTDHWHTSDSLETSVFQVLLLLFNAIVMEAVFTKRIVTDKGLLIGQIDRR